MKVTSLILAVASLVAAATASEQKSSKVSYDGYKMFHVETETLEDFRDLNGKIEQIRDAIPIHACSTKSHLDIAIPAHELESFDALNLNATVIHEDLGAAISEEGPLVPYERPQKGELPDAGTWFSAYHSYADHLSWLNDVQAAFPQNSELLNAPGLTFEGRNITGIHIWGSGGKGSKPAIHYTATVHAREWIATMVAEYILAQLVTGYGNDTTVTSYVDNYDWYIFPVINPDGFLYSQTTERLWRKNRQTRTGVTAVGTDINRNYPYKWGIAGGASTTPSADDYRGEAAGDTPEVKALVALSADIAAAHGTLWYIDFHSYSKAILLPYGYSCTVNVANLAKQQALGSGMKAAIAKPYGTSFVAGPLCKTLYEATGGSTDYLTDITKVTYAWGIELRGNSFVLPANQILPSGIEIWDGVQYFLGAV